MPYMKVLFDPLVPVTLFWIELKGGDQSGDVMGSCTADVEEDHVLEMAVHSA